MVELENILIKWLASESLKLKWIEDQEKNMNRLLQPCSFYISKSFNNLVKFIGLQLVKLTIISFILA